MRMSLPSELGDQLMIAAQDRSIVDGATHKFYRYPARFSPRFASAVIDAFSEPGDLVLDPFVGGGTTAVEAMISGRRCVGTDINELALFVSKVKTTPLRRDELKYLVNWFSDFESNLKISKPISDHEVWREKGYFRHLNASETWRHRNFVQNAIDHIEELPTLRLSDFLRCVLLRTLQLSLDGRKNLMSIKQLRAKLSSNFDEMIEAMSQLGEANEECAEPILAKCDAGELHNLKALPCGDKPKLVLTSPPYPGVHVLYHRWQVRGRRETPAPYWIANKLDGDGERYYTLGNRHEPKLRTYFRSLERVFSSLSRVVGQDTTVVQMVAFSEPDWQLPEYLKTMEKSGFVEIGMQSDSQDRIWREVPNRKWHAARQERRAGAREVVLIHRLG